eukprot:scaffold65721_cov20-Prasinocladus_malaysianus.AAC.1
MEALYRLICVCQLSYCLDCRIAPGLPVACDALLVKLDISYFANTHPQEPIHKKCKCSMIVKSEANGASYSSILNNARLASCSLPALLGLVARVATVPYVLREPRGLASRSADQKQTNKPLHLRRGVRRPGFRPARFSFCHVARHAF